MVISQKFAWQGGQGYFCSAKTPHEAKMATVLGGFRLFFFKYGLLLFPLIAYMIMHHPNHADRAAQVTEMLSHISNEQVRDQMITPMTMATYMPPGLMGAFAAVMFCAFVSTNDTYLHSWGSIFVQDVIMPFRKKPLDTKKHLLLLRLSIVGVAVFAICWSLFIPQEMDVWMFFALTGAIWLGGAGIVIMGGLYTSWGTTAGAYAALISGASIASTGLVLKYTEVEWISGKYLTGMWIYFWAAIVSACMYTGFSLLGKRKKHNMDKLLHRGQYRIEADQVVAEDSSAMPEKWTWRTALGITKEFTRGDKIIYAISIILTMLMLVWFLVMTSIGTLIGLTPAQWANCHRYFLWFWILACFVIAIWLGIGGIRDGISFIRDLRTANRDYSDDGRVSESNNDE